VLRFDWSNYVVPGACLVGGLKMRFLLRGLAPLLLIAIPLMISVVSHMTSYCHARITGGGEAKDKTPFGSGFKAAVLRALPYAISISFCLVQSVSRNTFSAWDCEEFMFDSATDTKKQFLREDLSIECGSEQHTQIKNVAYVFFAIWPVGMPLVYLLMLLPSRNALIKKSTTPLTRATSFLHEEYVGKLFWWEPLFVLQRLMVTGFVMVFFQAEFAVWRILFGIAVTTMYGFMLLIFRPYRKGDLNFLAAIGAQLALAFSMQLALCTRIFNDIAARHEAKDARQIMKFHDPSKVCTSRRCVVTASR
jgi:hypothetical protein